MLVVEFVLMSFLLLVINFFLFFQIFRQGVEGETWASRNSQAWRDQRVAGNFFFQCNLHFISLLSLSFCTHHARVQTLMLLKKKLKTKEMNPPSINNFWSVWSESRSDLQSGQPSSQPRESEWGPSAVRDASLHDQRGSHYGGQAQVQLQPRYPVDWRPHCWPALVRPTPQRGVKTVAYCSVRWNTCIKMDITKEYVALRRYLATFFAFHLK